MEDWVHRALARWPNVPALYGWLSLDRRGHWRIRGESISRPQIVETIDRNYGVDDEGRWYFQNGPQRGYMALEYAPFVLRVSDDARGLVTHNGLAVEAPASAWLDEEGAIGVMTEHGAGIVADEALPFVLDRLFDADVALDEHALAEALGRPSGQTTACVLRIAGRDVPVLRLDRERVPQALGFVREPQPPQGAPPRAGGP